MKLFRSRNRESNTETRTIYARYEVAHTITDYLAALCFMTGSLLSFQPGDPGPSTWFFLFGSTLFMAKPSIRLAREIQLFRMGEVDELAKRAP